MRIETNRNPGTRSRSSQYRMKKLLTDKCGPGSGLHTFKQLPDLIICGQKFGPECQRHLNERNKQQWAVEKPKLDNARKLRGIYFIDPDDKEFKETNKKRNEKVGTFHGSSHAL